MGLVAVCRMTINGVVTQGTAQLESTELRLNPGRVTIPFKAMTEAMARSGQLRVRYPGGEVTLDLGPTAPTWAQKIRYPRGRTEKLGVKPGCRIAVRGFSDPALITELKAAGGRVVSRLGRGPYDMVILRLASTTDLPLLAEARSRIAPSGMIWAVWAKGRREFGEDDIRGYGPTAGLVDVKVMSFSDELSGLKLVIPLARR